MEKEEKKYSDVDVQMLISSVMADLPKPIKIGERTYNIRALRAGTQNLIALEACKIAKSGESFGDIIKQFASNVPSVIRVITLAVLNDKDKIFGEEYQQLYDYIEWEVSPREYLNILIEVFKMLNIDAFFLICSQIDLFRNQLTKKRTEA
jgi:hypothetical protein